MYKLRGYAFCENAISKEIEKCPLNDGIYVKSWDEAHLLLTKAGFEYYMITLDEIRKEEN